MKTAPIALFVYNRPWHTRETVEALKMNLLAGESDLIIFSDGPKNDGARAKVNEVRRYLKTITGFHTVTINEKENNFGLANSIITGVSDIVNKFDRVIVVEDDLVTSPYFLTYMNEGLELYENDGRVISIHGYIYPIKRKMPETFFIKGADCWGWATWKRGWDLFRADGISLLQELDSRHLIHEFDFDGSYSFSGMLKRQIAGQNDSWAIRWYASAFLADKLTLYPGTTLVRNIGQDGSGTHGTGSDPQRNNPDETSSNKSVRPGRIRVEESPEARKAFKEYFKSLRPNLMKIILNKLHKYAGKFKKDS